MADDPQDPTLQSQPEPEPQPEPDPTPQPEPEPNPEPESEPAVTKPQDWRDREIARLRQRLREERAKAPAVAQATEQPTTAAVDPSLVPATEVESRANARAAEIAAQRDFDARCATAAEAGNTTYGPEFSQRVNALRGLVDQNDPQQVTAYNSFLIAALETGEAAKLVHGLGGDLDEAARIMALPPVRMAVELAKLSAKDLGEISRAPRPIRPIASTPNNRSPINPDDPARADSLSTAEWMARREAQVAAQRAAGRSVR